MELNLNEIREQAAEAARLLLASAAPEPGALCVIGCHEFMAAAAPEKAAHWWGLAATLAVFTVFTVYFSGGDFTGTAIQTIMVWLLAARSEGLL